VPKRIEKFDEILYKYENSSAPTVRRNFNMPTVMPENASVRKAVHWISKVRVEGTTLSLPLLIEQACMRFNLSPKDGDFLHRFFTEQKNAE
jgi:hypothetical protein